MESGVLEKVEVEEITSNLSVTDNVEITSQSECNGDEDLANTEQIENDLGFFIDKKGQFDLETHNESEEVINKQSSEVLNKSDNVEISEAVVTCLRPLCADYRSDSDSDSSTSTADSTSDTSSDSEDESSDSDDSGTIKTKKEQKTDYLLTDLPPIQELKISVSENACIEIGVITSIVDTLVVIESYKGTPALDVDTVLFLNCGKRTLGKIFDVLGPVSEPVYAVRFNSQEQIKNSQIEKGLKVYCAPGTQHTSFVFLSEIMKHRGSDASWKDNIEAPSEFQDFSDDEEERRHKMNKNSNGDEDGSRKRPFNKSTNIVQPGRFRPHNPQPRPNRFPNNQQRPFIRPNAHNVPIQPYQYNAPVYPGNAVLSGGPPLPHMYFTPRFSGPPFPTFNFNNQRVQQPFYQQRTHTFGERWRQQFVVLPPPPPPPPPPPQLPLSAQDGAQNPHPAGQYHSNFN